MSTLMYTAAIYTHKPCQFSIIPFSGFRGKVENVSANQRPGWPSCFFDQPGKHKLDRGR